MFSRKSEGEKRYDALAAEAAVTLYRLMRKDLNNLSDKDKAALATAGIFGGGLRIRCLIKALEMANESSESTKLKDRFLRAIGFGSSFPDANNPKVVRAVKEELVADHDAYQAKLDFLRPHGATAERIAQEAQRLSDELKTAGTLARDLKVGKPLKLKL